MNRPIQATTYLILAMREKWLNLILEGKKTAEVRRTRPAKACDMPDYLYLYHKGCIHGIAEVAGWNTPECSNVPDYAWPLSATTRTHKEACLTRREMLLYLKGASSPVVYLLGKVQRFDTPIPVPCRPQSWQYATPELLEIIQDRKEK